ncbi:YpjP family protein [Virgibacillus sp. L01]|uniref:YpjP family protein n=1 Tax=Virgibacillus sp. L01 TaxID=3457429 RepID=UPI003FD32AC8
MKLWFRKISVILIAIMTLGIYVPQISLETEAEESSEAISPKSDIDESVSVALPDVSNQTEPDQISDEEVLINEITKKAKEQTYTKMGPKIVTQVEDDFMTAILPKIEESLNMILADAGEDEVPYYNITEQPSQGLGEKIFNIYDNRTKKDIARFHVRRDNRPLEGYWFNFHYHLSTDGFENHHEIGEIYWDKNSPPKWMT